jgi:predicted ABC-type ATPase
MTSAEQLMRDEAICFARSNKKAIAKRRTDTALYPPEQDPVSVFMAGSPGAGKTEASIALINLFADTAILRIDPDELRSEFADYEGGNAWIFQSGVSILVEKILDCAFDQRQSFVLDGTLSNIDVARRNVDRSLRKGRFVQILYVYQNPLLAWDFVKAREEAEGRRIRPEHFVDQYFAARGFTKGAKSPFADFIRNAKSEQKKRVYSEVLTEATKQQNLVLMEAEAKRG